MWVFRKKLTNKGKIHLIWDELQQQLDEQGYSIKRVIMQDALFITSYPGYAPADKAREMQQRPGEARMERGP